MERLTRRGVLLALVTGNLTRIGWRKLDRAGLRRYFRFGAFGEMAKTRAGLAKLAIAEARRRRWIERGHADFADRRRHQRHYRRAKQPDPLHLGGNRHHAARGSGRAEAGLSAFVTFVN